ncbi:hypothetical protein DBR32_00495 [Taibaiella sp. KBW10]|uniref:hypothetical protein n=1 Tax=Taibaiella sp. KBW10 TaxID=2153357 RepID=UPI000F5AD230|nr:hypothetical protein [Taibaiella sp. KBW10]RQO32126.1 hypothetical protein DBR32_00495 [Taibaiella sp. KBW10]
MDSRARLIKAVDNSACLTRRQINDYILNKLFPEELYVVEMHLNECPFCNDAIEGFNHTDNANQLLSEIDILHLPAVAAVAPAVEKPAPAKVVSMPPVQPPVTPPKSSSHTKPFTESNRGKGGFWKMGIAAALVLGLGTWGITQWTQKGRKEARLLAEKTEAQKNEQERMNAPVSRTEDSAMNAKYGYLNQDAAPVVAKAAPKVIDESTSDSDAGAMNMAAADAVQAAPAAALATVPAPVIAKANVAKEKTQPKDNTLAKASEAKRMPEAKYEYEPTTSAASRVNSDANAQSKMMEANSKVSTGTTVAKARPSTKTAEERAKEAAIKKKAADQKAVQQAGTDYKKGLELYNKKQYAAALLYFQSVSKVSASPNQKQAANYVSLCKKKIADTEPAKKTKDTKETKQTKDKKATK